MEAEVYMKEALKEAEKALALEEVPIGAVVVKDGEIVGRGYNRRETDKDPTAHAEMIAIRQASEKLGGWRLHQCELYVTVEPCPMCAGAIMLSRIKKLYIGTADPKAGACGSLINIPQDGRFNHTVPMETGILEDECREILQRFFAKLREMRKKK